MASWLSEETKMNNSLIMSGATLIIYIISESMVDAIHAGSASTEPEDTEGSYSDSEIVF